MLRRKLKIAFGTMGEATVLFDYGSWRRKQKLKKKRIESVQTNVCLRIGLREARVGQ